mgnify:CR=1 FL=1
MAVRSSKIVRISGVFGIMGHEDEEIAKQLSKAVQGLKNISIHEMARTGDNRSFIVEGSRDGD